MRVLLGLTGGLAEVVLALPALAAFRRARPQWELHCLVTAGLEPLLEFDDAVDAYLTRRGGEDDRLRDVLARERYDASLLLHHDETVARLFAGAGIPRRYGRWWSLSSCRVLNRGRLMRRRPDAHACDRYLRTATLLGGCRAGSPAAPAPMAHPGEAAVETGLAFRDDEAPGARAVAFVHPGAGGGLTVWPARHYATVANSLAARPGWRVFITGSHADRPIIDALAPHLDPAVGVVAERFPLREFMGVLAAGDVIVAPDGGALHLAAALGLAAVGIHAPSPADAPSVRRARGRWCDALTPPVDCPARDGCLERHCLLHDCLMGILPGDVAVRAAALAERRRADLVGAGDPPMTRREERS
jgi:heptosyltransferase-3